MPRPAGFNGRVSARGHGTQPLRVLSLNFGLNIISSSDNQARSRRAFYPIITTGSSFTMKLGFISWEERERFNEWMQRFMSDVSEGTARYGTQTIVVPSYDFQRVGVPENDLVFGEGVDDVLYETEMAYIGASDPLNTDLSAERMGMGYYRLPKGSPEARFFHPLGTQVAGAEVLGETIFDPSPYDSGVNVGGGPDNLLPPSRSPYPPGLTR